MKTLNPAVARVHKRLHYTLDVILTCVRWYVAYPLSLRHLEEMMAERGIDHSTVHRWAIRQLPLLEKAFRCRKRPVGKSWRMDDTYIRVGGEWRYLYRPLARTAIYAPIGARLQHTALLWENDRPEWRALDGDHRQKRRQSRRTRGHQ